ncbi:MAG TPA: MFS transporter, partial [Thermomicrobiales bacterium]|nr:MFS transporter [Thermomicrobiales bacterium]
MLREPDFARFWTAGAVSLAGSAVTMLALPLLATLTLDATAFQIGLLAAAETIPLLALGLFAGVWLDRVRRRPVMIAADFVRAALLLAIPGLAWLGALRIEWLVAIGLL